MTDREREIEERVNEATEGPWEHEYDAEVWRVFGKPEMLTTVLTPGIPPRFADADLRDSFDTVLQVVKDAGGRSRVEGGEALAVAA